MELPASQQATGLQDRVCDMDRLRTSSNTKDLHLAATGDDKKSAPEKSGNILETSGTKSVRSSNRLAPKSLVILAPRVGLEPTTNGLTGLKPILFHSQVHQGTLYNNLNVMVFLAMAPESSGVTRCQKE
jgi:hypothetical protein